MATNKPDLSRIWASSAPGANIVDPDTTTPGKTAAGWTAEIPPYQHFNFLQNWFTAGLAHFNEQGVGVWDATSTYPINGLAKGSDGVVYSAVVEQSGINPVGDTTGAWAPWLRPRNIVTVEEFGGVADGVTDSLPAFNLAKSYLDTLNGGVILAMGDTYGLDGELTLDTDNIIIEGKGSGFHHDTGGFPPMTTLLRIGSATTPVVNITSASTFKASGSGLRRIRVNGNLTANIGLQVKTHNKVVLQDVMAQDSLVVNANFDVKVGMLEAADNQFGQVDGLYTNSGYPNSGTAADDAEGIVFGGDAVANTSLNLFKNLVAFHVNAIGIRFASSDNNIIQNMRTVRSVASTGLNNSLVFEGGASSLEVARGNVIVGASVKEVFAEGTTTKAVASYNNRILYDLENFGAVPVIDTGASLIWKTELMPVGDNIIQHDNGWYEVWGLQAAIPISSTAVVNLPFSFDSTTDMRVYTTIRTTFTGSPLGSPGGFANAVNQITIANTDAATALDIEWRVIGKKTS